jgi:hypothetical protein
MQNTVREILGGKPLAATSPEYLASIREARQDYREGHIITAEELLRTSVRELQAGRTDA